MEIDTLREKNIELWMKDHPESKTNEKVYIKLDGKDRVLEAWNIPTKLLIYNIRNGRFAAELLAKEKELKRKLKPIDAKDAKVIQTLLLEQKPSETEALRENIKEYGQIQCGIVTFDGAIINANRRMAIFSSLFEETRSPKFEYLRVAILPKNVNGKDLWRIEAGIQFGKTFILEYPPINELLKLNEGIKQGLKPEDIEATLLGEYDKKKILEKIEILKQIESYLEFIGKPKQYDLITEESTMERFNSLQKNVLSSLKNQGVQEEELYQVNLIAFSLISHGSNNQNKDENITHWDVRKLRDIMKSDEAKKELLCKYNFDEPEKTNHTGLIESFRAASEIVENEKVHDKPKKLLKRAFDAIHVIDEKSPKLKENESTVLISQIEGEVKRLKKGNKDGIPPGKD